MKLYNRLISIFNNFSLQKKIFYSYFFLCFLLISILSVSICTFTASSLRRRNTFSLQQNFNQAVSYLSYKLDGISSTSDMLIYNISLNSILNQTASTYSSNQQVNDSKEILHLLKTYRKTMTLPRPGSTSPITSAIPITGSISAHFPRQSLLFGGILSLSKRGFICLSDSRIWKTILTAPQMESRCFVPCTNKTTTIHLPSLSVWMFR